MADSTHDSDVAFVKALAELLRENDLTELEVRRDYAEKDRLSVRVSRGAPARAIVTEAPVQAEPSVQSHDAAPKPVSEARSEGDPAQHPGAVTSPMVGTCYMQAEPGSPPFVSVGDKVAEGQTILIIEAMKTMNHIPAPSAGTVKRVLVDDGAPVEFGAPLMIIE